MVKKIVVSLVLLSVSFLQASSQGNNIGRYCFNPYNPKRVKQITLDPAQYQPGNLPTPLGGDPNPSEKFRSLNNTQSQYRANRYPQVFDGVVLSNLNPNQPVFNGILLNGGSENRRLRGKRGGVASKLMISAQKLLGLNKNNPEDLILLIAEMSSKQHQEKSA